VETTVVKYYCGSCIVLKGREVEREKVKPVVAEQCRREGRRKK
jgi:hypothetical protein